MRKAVAVLGFVALVFGSEFRAYEIGVEDAVYFLKNYRSEIPPPGWWVILDVTDLSLPKILLLMKLGEMKTGKTPAYLWKGGRDFLVFVSFPRRGDAEELKRKLESYGVYGIKVEKIRKTRDFKPRIVEKPHLCNYPEYRGVEGLKALLRHAISVAYSVDDPSFNRNAFIEDVTLMIMKLDEYERKAGVEEQRIEEGVDVESLLREAMEW